MSEPGDIQRLLVRLAESEASVAARDEVIVLLRKEIAELRARLDANSRNSSKPPGSDSPFEKPAVPRSLRRRSGRKPGGQDGHEGTTLRQVEVPDRVVEHEPVCCGGCGADLAGCRETGRVHRQVFDLPPAVIEVTEHHLLERQCGCGTRTRAAAPVGVEAPVQYGRQVMAVIVYLYLGQFLSKARTAQAMAELFALPVSEATVSAAVRRAADGLGPFLDRVRERLTGSAVVNFDETGLRVAGKLHWVHAASTGKYSLLIVHPKRGTEAMNALGVLPGFTGIAVHDAWAPYDTYTASTHALCGAHVLRELQAVTDHAILTDPGGWCWATQAADALVELLRLTRPEPGTAPLPAPMLRRRAGAARTRLRSAVRLGAEATAGRESNLQAKHHALAKRLIDRQADYLRFTADPDVPFDNNAAEREIRMVKLRQKVSGSQRTLTGAQQFAAIRSYTATANKHRIGLLHALTELLSGRAWLPA